MTDNFKLPWHSHRPRTAEEVEVVVREQLRVRVVEDGECRIWTGPTSWNGYGRLAGTNCNSDLSPRAHVASYQLFVGPVPDGLMVCHHCDRPGCINPKHLWLGTNQQNQQDASAKGSWQEFWNPQRRAKQRERNTGEGNPMYGKTGADAPCYGRTGEKHPMYGKNHSEATRAKIAAGLRKFWNINND